MGGSAAHCNGPDTGSYHTCTHLFHFDQTLPSDATVDLELLDISRSGQPTQMLSHRRVA